MSEVWAIRRRLRAESIPLVHAQLCAEVVAGGFDRALVLTIEPGQLLSADAVGPLAHPPSDALRRRARATPISLSPDCRETEIIRACASERAPKRRSESVVETALQLPEAAIAVLAPESRPLALVVGVTETEVLTPAAEAGLQAIAHIAEPVLEAVVLKTRMRELDAELRYLAASAHAFAQEAVGSPIALTDDQRQGPQFPPPPANGADPLRPRDREMMTLIAAGRTNRDIAAELHLSIETVKDNVALLLRKLGASNRTEAVVLYMRQGGQL